VSSSWTVTKEKLNGAHRTWRAHDVGRDSHGLWLFVPEGTPNLDPSGRTINQLTADGVQLIVSDAWWTAWWWSTGSITVDIATPAETTGSSIAYVDLELDLWAKGIDCGSVDHDEYDASRRAGLITDEQDAHARRTTDDIVGMLAGCDEPFATVGWAHLASARQVATQTSQR